MKNMNYIFVLLVLLSLQSISVKSEEQAIRRKITVTGTSDVKIIPDIIYFHVGVENWNKNLTEAKRLNDKRIRDLISITKKYNIADKNIQTSSLNLSPTYKNYKEDKIKGYQVLNNVSIELTNIAVFDSLMEEFIDAGLNNIYGIEFKSSESIKHRSEARKLAVRAARNKAEEMAGELGMKVGKAIEISEIPINSSGYGYLKFASNSVMDETDGENLKKESTAQGGEIRVQARVQITFELE